MHRLLTALTLGLLLLPTPCVGQESEDEALRERIRALEDKVERLEGEKQDQEPQDEEAKKDEETKKDEEAKKSEEEKTELPKDEETKLPKDDEDAEPDGFPIELPRSIKLKIYGRVRVRGEYRDPSDLRVPGTQGRAATDDPAIATDFVLLRTRVGLDFTVHEHLRAVAEIQDSRRFGDQAIAQDSADLHLYQGYMELRQPLDIPLWVKAGRYEIPSLGDSRLLSSLDFSNVGRSWDGFQATYRLGYRKETNDEGEEVEKEDLWVTGILTNIREGAVFAADRDENDDFWFSGIYASLRTIKDHELDAYIFWRHLSDRTFGSEESTRLGDRKDFTIGARIKGAAGPLGYSGEIVYQWGDQAGDRVSAWAAAVRPYFKLALSEEMKLTITAEYTYASGDRDPTDGKLQTFDPLFTFGHYYHGFNDVIGWRNIHSGMLGFAFSPFKGFSLHCNLFHFWLDKRKDAWYGANKRAIRRDTTGNGRSRIGGEVDLFFKAKLWKRLFILGGYSRFIATQYVRDTVTPPAGSEFGRGNGADQDWVHLQVELKF